LPRESFHVLFLDRKNGLIAAEQQSMGKVDQTSVYPREVSKRALELNASALVMVHNHPSGDPTPSDADIEITRAVEAAGQSLGVALHDHVIISRRRDASLRVLGLIWAPRIALCGGNYHQAKHYQPAHKSRPAALPFKDPPACRGRSWVGHRDRVCRLMRAPQYRL
jgi:hypothetical protein